jgi:hypothetical protein
MSTRPARVRVLLNGCSQCSSREWREIHDLSAVLLKEAKVIRAELDELRDTTQRNVSFCDAAEHQPAPQDPQEGANGAEI